MKGLAATIISPAITMTEVVPSPTSSSCAWEKSNLINKYLTLANSIMLLAAGCYTSISRRIAFPSFVITIPPMGSRSIFNIDLGPRVEMTISETAFAA